VDFRQPAGLFSCAISLCLLALSSAQFDPKLKTFLFTRSFPPQPVCILLTDHPVFSWLWFFYLIHFVHFTSLISLIFLLRRYLVQCGKVSLLSFTYFIVNLAFLLAL
jgi:hypothetical protein